MGARSKNDSSSGDLVGCVAGEGIGDGIMEEAFSAALRSGNFVLR